MEEPLIVIVSHKRAKTITTHKLVPGVVCVPESQADEYAAAVGKERVVAHPDTVVGISPKRQWIVNHFKDVFMLDDDIRTMLRKYTTSHFNSALTPDEARDRIVATRDTAEEMGAYHYGFSSHANPVTYSLHKPFKFGGYIPGGAFGLRAGHGLHFPNTLLPVEDWWICALNISRHRVCLIDERFAFNFMGTYTAPGGMSEYRHQNSELEAVAYLKRAFGDAIEFRPGRISGATKVQRNEGNRSLVIPWPH